MYNRILKRPMFKRGGSSFQAQGTGITSPYDTPRKRYALGSWEDWETKTRDITKDPRGDWSYAAQGFSELGNPYKESGEAKTIGEMLYAGAAGVRGSKDKARELEQKGELAILESQAGRMLSDEERAFKAEEAAKERALKLQVAKEKGTYPDMHPGKLYDSMIKDWRTRADKNKMMHPGWELASDNLESFVNADLQIRKIHTQFGPTHVAQAVPPEAFADGKTIDIKLLRGGVVYYDPIDKEWFTIKNPGTAAAEDIVAESYIIGFNNLDPEEPTSTQPSSTDLENPDPEKKKEAKKYTQKDYEKSTAETTEKIKERFTLKGDITQGVNPYMPKADQAITELDDLKGWWNNQVWNKKDEG
jgi:hypothetical protein